MADTDNTAAASKLGFLPKLMLWSLVLLFAYLYLGAVERHGGSAESAADDVAGGQVSAVAAAGSDGVVAVAEQAETSPAEQQAATSPAAQEAASNSGSTPTIPPALDAPSVAVAPAPVAAVMSAPAPIAPQPARQSASAPAPSERATQPAGPVAGAASEAPEHQVSKAEAEAFAHAVMQKPTQDTVVPVPPAPVSAPAPTRALTPPAARQSAPQMPSFAVTQQPMQAMPAPMPRPGVAPSSTAEGSAATDAQRAISDYEARRRQAIEEARQRWEQAYRMRPAAPAPYYGYPGYYPPRAAVPAPQQQQRD